MGIAGTKELKDGGSAKGDKGENSKGGPDAGDAAGVFALLLNGWMLPVPGLTDEPGKGQPREQSSGKDGGKIAGTLGSAAGWAQISSGQNATDPESAGILNSRVLAQLFLKEIAARANPGRGEKRGTASTGQSTGSAEDKLLSNLERMFTGVTGTSADTKGNELDKYREIITGLLNELNGKLTVKNDVTGLKPEIETIRQLILQQLNDNADPEHPAGQGKMPGTGDQSGVKTTGSQEVTLPAQVRMEQAGDLAVQASVAQDPVVHGPVDQGLAVQASAVNDSMTKNPVLKDLTGESPVAAANEQLQKAVENGPVKVQDTGAAQTQEISPQGQTAGNGNQAIRTEVMGPAVMEKAPETNTTHTGDMTSGDGMFRQSSGGDGKEFKVTPIPETDKEKAGNINSGSTKEQTFNITAALETLNQVKGLQNNNLTDPSPPVWRQIVTAFREQVLNQRPPVKELNIQLQPADLGKIQIALNWENGQVHLQIVASDSQTARMLQHQAPELRQSLLDIGVSCGRMDMGMGGENRNQQQSYVPQRSYYPGMGQAEAETGGYFPGAYENGGEPGNYRINVTA